MVTPEGDKGPEIEDPLEDLDAVSAKTDVALAEKLKARRARLEAEALGRQRGFQETADKLRVMYTQMNQALDNGENLDEARRIYDEANGETELRTLSAYDDLPGYDVFNAEIERTRDEINKRREEIKARKSVVKPEPEPNLEPPTSTGETKPDDTFPPKKPARKPRKKASPVVPPTPEPTVEPVTVPETTPTPPVTPEPEPTAPPAPRTPEELQALEEKMNEARTKYLKHLREWNDSKGVRGWIQEQTGRKERIKEALDQVERAYHEARAEYIANEVEKVIAERSKLEEEELKLLYSPDKPGLLARIHKGYKALGESSWLVDMNNSGRIKKALFNKRAVISMGLLATGVLLSGPVGWTAAGGALLTARAGLAGTFAGIGSADLVKNYRQAYLRKDLSKKPSYTEDEYNEVIMAMKARGLLDGNLPTVLNSPEYKQAIEARNERTRERFASLTPEERADRASNIFVEQQELLNRKIVVEKKWNKGAIATGVVVGLSVGGFAARGLIQGWLKGEAPPMVTPTGSGVASADTFKNPTTVSSDMLGHDKPVLMSEVAVENAPQVSGTVLEVGSRGFEGALLDLKGSNPDLYKTMIENLKSADPNFKGDDGGLVHRFMERFASENGLNIDADGGKDLSDVYSGKIMVEADGTIKIGEYELMPEKTPPTPEATFTEATDSSDTETQTTNTETPVVEPAPKTPEPLNLNTTSPWDIINTKTAPDLSIPENVPDTSTTNVETSEVSDSTEEKDWTQHDATADRLREAVMAEKNTDALKIAAGDNYKNFVKEIGLSDRNLNELGNLDYSQFVEKVNADESFAKKYAKFMGWLAQERLNHPDNEKALGASSKLRIFLIAAAERSK